MERYDWIIQVIEDLEKFAENEALNHLQKQLKRTRFAYEADIRASQKSELSAGCND